MQGYLVVHGIVEDYLPAAACDLIAGSVPSARARAEGSFRVYTTQIKVPSGARGVLEMLLLSQRGSPLDIVHFASGK